METQLQMHTTYMVPTETVKSAPFNPRGRTEAKQLRRLLEDIRTAGMIMSPLLVSSIDGFLGDGHRRLACAKTLGMTTVPVQYVPLSSTAIYALNNNGMKPQGGRGWAAAAAQGFPVEELPIQQRKLIALWQEALGPEDFNEMAQRRSSDIVTVARSVQKFINQGSGHDSLRVILLWLDKHNMARAFIDAKRDGISSATIEKAIIEDRPLRQVWS